MYLLDEGIQNAKALIVDGNTSSRSLLAAQLRDLGVGTVRMVGRVKEARLILENQSYDIVLCDAQIDGADSGGQDLLDELRRVGLLPYATVFVMMTNEATYARVAEAAEAALDAYLIKPHTSASLAERLTSARHRKRVLKDIFDAIERQDFETGARLCLQRFESRARYWLYAARIGAELLLRLGKYPEAQQMYEAIVAAKTVPWAKLGVARAQLASGNPGTARRTLEDLVGELPGYADSHDLLGHLQMEQGDLNQALQTYQTATSLTPGCLLRLQRCGSLAYYAGQRDQALELLERAAGQGLKSKLFDMLSLMMVGLMRFDRSERKGLNFAYDALNAAIWRLPPSKRLQRFERCFATLTALLDRQLPQAQALTMELGGQVEQGDFDLEGATLLVALWTRLLRQGVPWDVARPAIETLGLRYCTSKASTEVLVASTEGHEQAGPLLRECHHRIFGIAETAVRHSIRGNAAVAVELLLRQGESSRNAKLIDMAALVLKRHAAKLEDPAHYEEQVRQLQERYVIPMGWRGLLRGRDIGAVALRVPSDPATLSLPVPPEGST